MTNRRNSIGDDQRGGLSSMLCKPGEDVFLGFRIYGRKTVIENQHRGHSNQTASECRSLFLSPRKRDAALTDHRIQSTWKLVKG